MFKKLTFLLPLALLAPLAFGNIADSSVPIFASAVSAEGEYNGYHYTQSGFERFYDSSDFGPTITKHFWAPSGYKFTADLSDEQLDLMLDQAEGVGIDYSYVLFSISYTKFGMEIYLNTFINGFRGDNLREQCHDWTKNCFDSEPPFYEIKDATIQTDISFNVKFVFDIKNPVINSGEFTLNFKSETLIVEPFDASDYIKISAQYYCTSGLKNRFNVDAYPLGEFFDETPDHSGYGFVTNGTMERFDRETFETVEQGAKYKMTLYAYKVDAIGDVTNGYKEIIGFPSRPITVNAKLEFDYIVSVDEESGAATIEHFECWSKDFVVGDPDFKVAIDGNGDRTSVQQGSEHEYSLQFNNYAALDEEVDLSVTSTARPSRLSGGGNLVEYYDFPVGPDGLLNYYITGSFNWWNISSDYLLKKIEDNHFRFEKLFVEAGEAIDITDSDNYGYYNETTYDGCGYTINTSLQVIVNETGYYNIDFYPNGISGGNHFTLTKIPDFHGYADGAVEYYLTGSGDGFYNILMDTFKFYVDLENSNHFYLEDVVLDKYYNLYARNDWQSTSKYVNESTFDGCGYTIDSDGYVHVTETGRYHVDLYLNQEDGNHLSFTRNNWYVIGSFNDYSVSNAWKLNYDGRNDFSLEKELQAGDSFKVVDYKGTEYTNPQTWECSGFTLDEEGNIVIEKAGKYVINFHLYDSNNIHIQLKKNVLPIRPAIGEETFIYYVASEDEVRLHSERRDEEFLSEAAGGIYYVWDAETEQFTEYQGVDLIKQYSKMYLEYFDPEDLDLIEGYPVIPYSGQWYIYLCVQGSVGPHQYYFETNSQELEVAPGNKSDIEIMLNVPDEVNLIQGADDLEIYPRLSYKENIDYYYNWEMSKEGIVEFEEQDDAGTINVKTVGVGVTYMTVSVESKLFAPVSKTISVRVLDQIYDVAKIKVPNEFHYAGKDLTAAISVRGFTNIQNVNIDWKVTNKAGSELDTTKLVVNKDATVTLLKAESDDYTITAYYEGVKLDTIKVQVRYTDLNKFLKANVWWILLMTIGLVVFVVLMRKLFKRGKTTVENIEKVYQVFCQCLSDDKLTLPELKLIKREITKCVHRCEDLNIEAFNQYEKSIRYLRKSLADTNALIKKWDNISIEDKSAFTEKLNLDLAKALNVAREIENAKELVDQYHMTANRKNYETIVDDKVGAKGNKSKL